MPQQKKQMNETETSTALEANLQISYFWWDEPQE